MKKSPSKFLLCLLGLLWTTTFSSYASTLDGVMEDGRYEFVSDEKAWDTVMKDLKALNCHTFILQQSVQEAPKGSGQNTYTCFGNLGVTVDQEYDNTILSILTAASNNDIKVYIGLYSEKAPKGGWANNHTESQSPTFDPFLTKVFGYDKIIIHDTEDIVRNNDNLSQALAGYYLPQELAQSQDDPVKVSILDNLLIPVTNEVHGCHRLFMLSPYFTHNGGTVDTLAQQEGAFWSFLLTYKNACWQPDIVMPQDGVGAGNVKPDEVQPFFAAYQKAFDQLKPNDPQLWLVFEMSPSPDDNALKARLASEAVYAKKVTGFCLFNLFQIDGTSKAVTPNPLYNDLITN